MKEKKQQHTGLALYLIYLIMLVGGIVALGKIIWLQTCWTPEEKIARAVTPQTTHLTIDPIRGDILDCKGRVLAMSYPVYIIRLDCTVGTDEWWEPRAKELAAKLPSIFPEKNQAGWWKTLKSARKKGRKYEKIGRPVDHKTLNKLATFPLLKEGRNRGGFIYEQRNTRRYPYGSLARRTIGFVRTVENPDVTNNAVGLEGRFNKTLKGREGSIWMRQTDKGRLVRNNDSTMVEVVNGQNLVTTLDIDFQEKADAALRKYTEHEHDIMAACLVLMDVKTGAIRTMVNLNRNPKTLAMEESQNIAIGRRHEPGSIFKTVTLAAMLQDGLIPNLNVNLPTNHGVVTGTTHRDHHIIEWEKEHRTSRISVLDGYKISSNYVFATLALMGYENDYDKYFDALRRFHLMEGFDFDLDGLQKPFVPTPKSRYFTKTDLGSMGFGYTTEETPLQMLTFYNAIAGKGRMMKPYLIEGEGGPLVLDESIFSAAVADTLTRAMRCVVTDGTARGIKDAAVPVAAKTGTSFGTFQVRRSNGKMRSTYTDSEGRSKYQGSLAGFFPADDPQYSFICCVYSRPTRKSYQGGGIPTRVMKELVNDIRLMDPYWRDRI